jgi:SAM-dependent methyltransferase
MSHVRGHLDRCQRCWQAWNRLRWNRAAGTPLYAELVDYLGDRFIPYYDSSRALADAWEHAAPRTAEQISRFYRDTDAYLYNQVIWHASGNRPHYVKAALPILARHLGTLILDYGCGIGEDVLALHRAGHQVIGCDLPSPPTDFLAWRAARQGYLQPAFHPDTLPGLDAPIILWIMDALDHIADLDAALGHLVPHADLLICENLLVTRGHGRQGFHHRRPLPSVQQWLARYGLTRESHEPNPAILTMWNRTAAPTRNARPACPRLPS